MHRNPYSCLLHRGAPRRRPPGSFRFWMASERRCGARFAYHAAAFDSRIGRIGEAAGLYNLGGNTVHPLRLGDF